MRCIGSCCTLMGDVEGLVSTAAHGETEGKLYEGKKKEIELSTSKTKYNTRLCSDLVI